jgi:hypothetical protein
MLRRQSTKSKSDLRRRKSTASVCSVHLEHIDAEVAQRDAQTAAMEAFSRALARQSADGALFPPQPSGSRKESTSPSGLSRSHSTAGLREGRRRPGLERRQSVRFVGPESRLKTRASRISMRTAAPESPESIARRSIHRSQSTQNISYLPRSVLCNFENLPLSHRTSSVGKTVVTPRSVKTELSQAYLQALTPEYEQYTPEDDIASMPSSYRRIRKTRSTLTAGASSGWSAGGNARAVHGSSPQDTNATAHHKQTISGTLFPRYSFIKRRENTTMTSSPKLRSPKSMSFLKSRRHRSVRKSSIECPRGDASPLMGAQETSLSPRMLPKSPKIFASKYGGPRREIPKTLKCSSASMELPVSGTGASLDRSRSGSLRNRARKVSSSLRSKLKSLFITKSEERSGLPAQQIEAQRTHVSEICEDNPLVTTMPEQNHCRERSSLSKVSTHIPSLNAVPSHERPRSRRGSVDSCKSAPEQASGERSRVTSWASTETNTVIASQQQESTEAWERQRLSIINEHGIRKSPLLSSNPAIGLQTTTSQEELTPLPASTRLPPGATIDSQRVYSALMKKMNETQQLARIVEQQRRPSDGSNPFRTVSPSSSNGCRSDSDDLPIQTCAQQVGDHPSCEAPHGRQVSLSHENKQSVTDDHRSLSPPIHLTPQGRQPETAKTIMDRGSPFFGSPTSHLFRTTSPYRRLLQQAMHAEREQALCQDPVETTYEATAVATKPHPTTNVAYSESNYSSDTLIHKTGMSQCGTGARTLDELGPEEEADVFESTPTYRPTGDRRVSTASSLGWKTLLSADVAKLEQSPTRVSGQSPDVEYRIPTMPKSLGHGHVRESAQTGSCEEDQHNAKPPVHMPTSSTTPLSAIASNVVKLSPQHRSVMRTTTPPTADLHRGRFLTSAEHNTSALSCDGTLPNNYRGDPGRPPASPADETRPSWSHKPAPQLSTPVRRHAVRQSKSLAGLKRISGIREPQTGSPKPPISSTVRLMRKSASKLAANAVSAASSPGFTGAFERQFGSIGHHLEGQLAEKENLVPQHNDVQTKPPTTKGQFRGSKAMVDVFLSSRRRRGENGGDTAAFV